MKKGKKILGLVFLCMVALTVFLLVACGDKNDGSGDGDANIPPDHTHALTLVDATAADCETSGNSAYYACTCGKWFWDSNGVTEIIDKASVDIKATGHSYAKTWSKNNTHHWHAATCKHINEKSDLQNHVMKDGVCTFCGYSGNGIYFNTLQVGQDDTAYGKVSNATTVFSFLKEITVPDDVNYTVCTDLACTQTVPSKTVSLEIGDNIFYILAEYGNRSKLYTVTVRRRPKYTVSYNTNGGSAVETQQIEEDDTISAPMTAKTGYSFVNWTVDDNAVTFPYTIAKNTELHAVFTANTYVVTLDVNGGDGLEQSTYNAVYDSEFTPVTPTRTGYTFEGWYDGETKFESTVWRYAENKTFTAQWQKNSYSLELNKNAGGGVLGAGTIEYGQSVTITAETYLGYTWRGWYSGDILVSTDLSYTFDMPAENITYTAKWVVAEEMQIFEFTSSETECTITGVKDKNVTEITIPNYVTRIEDYAFNGCRFLAGIIIPDGVTSIGNYAFYNCSRLTSVIIGDGVTSIGNAVFVGCTIENATIPAIAISRLDSRTLKTVIITSGYSIEKDAFRDFSSLTSISIPNSVASIGDYAFNNCSSLTSVAIGNGVTSIGHGAFNNCKLLKSVYYTGTAEDWNKINIDVYNGEVTSATCYYYSGAEPPLNIDGTDYNGNYWHYAADGVTPVIWKKENN